MHSGPADAHDPEPDLHRRHPRPCLRLPGGAPARVFAAMAGNSMERSATQGAAAAVENGARWRKRRVDSISGGADDFKIPDGRCAIDALFPRRCPVCGRIVPGGV